MVTKYLDDTWSWLLTKSSSKACLFYDSFINSRQYFVWCYIDIYDVLFALNYGGCSSIIASFFREVASN